MNDEARTVDALARELVQVAVRELDQALQALDPTIDYQPTRDRVLVMLIPEEYVSAGGLVLAVGEKPSWRGMVLSVGPRVNKGHYGDPYRLKRGDIVIIDGVSGHVIPHWGADQAGLDLRLIQAGDIMAIMEGATIEVPSSDTR